MGKLFNARGVFDASRIPANVKFPDLNPEGEWNYWNLWNDWNN
jgi:hypothetical protein